VFSGEALAGCVVATGTITVTNCDTNERIDATATVGPAKLEVSDVHLATTGSDDNGYLSFKANAGSLDIELALNDGTSIKSDNYLGVDVRTNAGGDIKVTTENDVTIEAEQAGIYAETMTVGDIEIINYASIHAGIGTGDMGSDAIKGVSNGGTTTIKNYAHIESDNGRGIVSDGGYVAGVDKVSIYNEGEIESFGDGLRVNAGGSFGADAEIVNKGKVTGQDRRGVVAWSYSGDTTITNSGEVTSYGGQAIYGMADAGKVTITNDSKLRVIDNNPQTADVNDTSFAGIEAAVDGTGDIEVKNLDDGDILTYDIGIYAQTGSGKVAITNDGKIVSGRSGILTSSKDGDVTIDNTGSIFANGGSVELGAVSVVGPDVAAVKINNKTGGIIVANSTLDFTPTAGWLDGASIEDLTDLALDTSSRNAVTSYLGAVDSITVTNDGTIVGTIQLGGPDQIGLGTARIENNGLWVTSSMNGSYDGDGVIANSGRIHSLGTTQFYGNVENSGDIVVTSLGEAAADGAPGVFGISGNYTATGDARLVLDWPEDSVVGLLSPSLYILGDVTGETEVVIGRGDALADFAWDGTPRIAVVAVEGTATEGADHFTMQDQSYGMLNFKLVYDDTDGQTWFLELDAIDGADAVAEVPFAARNLFKLATEGVTDRLDELRNVYAGNSGDAAPLGYAASPNDPVTAALALNQPTQPTTNAWMKTTGRYGQADNYDTISGVIEAGIDTQVDTGSGTAAIGVFGGLGGSQVDFDLANSEATLSGPLVGAYANYATGGAFFGAIAAVQSVNVDLTLSGADASFGGLTYGGRVDAGYRFGDELIIEPAIALAASHTEFDTFEMNAMDVGFVDADSLATEARLRVAKDYVFDGVTLTPFAVATVGYDFLGGDGVDAPPTPVVMGNNGGAYGDLSGGLTIANDDATLSGFAKGNVGYAAGELSGGVRLGANAAF